MLLGVMGGWNTYLHILEDKLNDWESEGLWKNYLKMRKRTKRDFINLNYTCLKFEMVR